MGSCNLAFHINIDGLWIDRTCFYCNFAKIVSGGIFEILITHCWDDFDRIFNILPSTQNRENIRMDKLSIRKITFSSTGQIT